MWNSVVGWFISSATSNTGFHETKAKGVGNCSKFTHCSPKAIGLDGKLNFHNFCKKKPKQTRIPGGLEATSCVAQFLVRVLS